MRNKQKKDALTFYVGWIVSIIFFLIGFYHTGHGLMSYQVLGFKYGSFIISFGILLLMFISYSKAVSGSKTALGLYILFALVNFTCNINSFYPNDQGEYLYKKELSEKKLQLSLYQANVEKAFLDKRVIDNITTAERLKLELVEQIKNGGFKEKSDEKLKEIENVLALQQKITRLPFNQNFNQVADRYLAMVSNAIAEYKERHGFTANSVNPLVQEIQKISKKFSPLLDFKLTNPKPLINFENPNDKKTADYLLRNLVSEINNFKVKAEKNASVYKTNLSLKEMQYDNNEFGKFSHTFRAIPQNFDKAGTWYVIAICLLIDFIIPLAMYFLLRRDNNSDGKDQFASVFSNKNRSKSFNR